MDNSSEKISGQTLAFLSLRLWIGVRAVMAGLDKFSGKERIFSEDPATGETFARAVRVYSLENYKGIPLRQAEILAGDPLFPQWALTAFAGMLGSALILLGIMLLAGAGTRIALCGLAILFTALTAGMTILDTTGAGAAWLGIHIGLIAAALLLASHNRFALFPQKTSPMPRERLQE